MTRIENSIEIDASPEKIWPMIQWDKMPEWLDSCKKAVWTSKDKYKVGSTLQVRSELGGMKGEMDVEMTEVIENEKLAWQSTSKNAPMSGIRTLSPTKAGTKVTTVEEYEMPYSILGKLIDKLQFHKAFEKSVDIGLKKLKDMLEK